MQRTLYKDLVDWKNRSRRKPLILLGARQVGKTYILKEFGGKEFNSLVYFNCHKDSYASELFRDVNADRILNELSSYCNVVIVPGETLVVFDEIQEVKNGIASLKYFCEDHSDLHVAVAGSLLGISLREGESYPVGKVETMRLFPMTFSEYLLAKGRNGLLATLDHQDWETLKAQSDIFVSLLREYCFVGGMPEAVAEYIETENTARVRLVQMEILDAYRRDMAKHTKPTTQRINMVWDSIPSQLARENKKFVFGAVRKGGRAADFEIAIQWLTDAGIAVKVPKTREPRKPLKFYADNTVFKLYMQDCGLLACMSNAAPRDMLLGNHPFVEFKGAFTENYVLQQILPYLNSIYYFSKDNSTQEIDFLIENDNRVIPIEVKAEVNVKSKSLAGFINRDHADKKLKGVRFSMQPYEDQGWMENIPLFAVESFIRHNL